MVASAGREPTKNEGTESAVSSINSSEEVEFRSDNDSCSENKDRPDQQNHAEVIRRKIPKCSGIYIKGSVHGVPVYYTVDTGASRTIVSWRIFNQIPKSNCPSIQVDKQVPLEQANGTLLEMTGMTNLDLHLGDQVFPNREVVVADIKDDVLLGMDMGKTMDVIVSEKLVKIDGKPVACTHINGNCVRKVTSADDYSIPGNTEYEIEVYVENMDGHDGTLGEMILEPSQDFLERHPLVVARSLVDLDNNVTGRMRLMNPFDMEAVIHQDTVVGFAELLEPSEVVNIVVNSEELLEAAAEKTKTLFKDKGNLALDIEQSDNVSEPVNKRHRENDGSSTVIDICDKKYMDCSDREHVGSLGSEQSNKPNSGLAKCIDPIVLNQNNELFGSATDLPSLSWDDSDLDTDEEIINDNPHITGNTAIRQTHDVQASGLAYKREIPSHLTDLYSRSTKEKPENELFEVEDILCSYKDIFSVDDNDLGQTHLAHHGIDTGDSRPVKQPPRRVPMALAHEEVEAIQQLLQQGVIRESNSPWASPIVLVRKKSGKIRPCVDYRRVNSLTKKDAYPIPRTQECLDAMAGSVIFSTLDMTSGYNQIPIIEKDIPKTAFVTRHGLWEFLTMPFGLTNAPATFQRVMELVCRGLQWTSCLIYLDDILIFGKTFREHSDRLREVLQRIRRAGLKLKPEKCELFQKEVKFLGHIVTANGIRPDPMNTSRIVAWPEPKTVTEVRAFLGLCSYYRRFVQNFSIIAKPLSDLTSKESELQWTDRCQKAFDELKAKLIGPAITAFPQDEGPYILDTDACDVGIGAVLSQVQNGTERVVAYASRSLNRAERNYCVTDKELLAIRYFIEYFRHYLLGRTFNVRTDHQAIRWLFQLKEPKGRIARWIEILSAYNFSIEYRSGKKHGNADALSRCPNPRDCQCSDYNSLESLRCGPCRKCQKRSIDMQLENKEPIRLTHTTDTPAGLSEKSASLSFLWRLMATIIWLGSLGWWPHSFSEPVDSFSDMGTNVTKLSFPEEAKDDGRLRPKLSGSR